MLTKKEEALIKAEKALSKLTDKGKFWVLDTLLKKIKK